MPTQERRRLTGTCLCGGIVLQVEDRFRYALNCHCSLCRRTTGAAFKPLAGIEADALSITQGDELVQRFGETPGWHNVNCRRCGSFLFAVVQDGAFVHVALGCLQDDPSIRPSMHIFVGSKAPWYAITDDLPQYEAFPPMPFD